MGSDARAPVEARRPTSVADAGESPAVALERFRITRGSFTLGPISTTVRRGERVALLGRNGAGKSTLLSAVGGLLPQYAGRVVVAGHDARIEAIAVRERVGVLPEVLPGYPWMTAAAYLDFLAPFYPRWDADYATSLARQLAVPADTRLGRMSKGMRVKLAFVAAEAHRPELLLLDEPTSGLDPMARRELIDVVASAARSDPDRTVLFSTHLLEDVEWLADRVIALREGAVVTDTTRAEIDTTRRPDESLSHALFRLMEGIQ